LPAEPGRARRHRAARIGSGRAPAPRLPWPHARPRPHPARTPPHARRRRDPPGDRRAEARRRPRRPRRRARGPRGRLRPSGGAARRARAGTRGAARTHPRTRHPAARSHGDAAVVGRRSRRAWRDARQRDAHRHLRRQRPPARRRQRHADPHPRPGAARR